MTRLAGNESGYSFRVMDTEKGEPSPFGFNLPSATTIIKGVLGSTGGGMAWWGFKLGIRACHPTASEEKIAQLYERKKHSSFNPNAQRDSAGDRGTDAHAVAAALLLGNHELMPDHVLAGDMDGYEEAAHNWVTTQMGGWEVVLAEQPVWSLEHRFAGTPDLVRKRSIGLDEPTLGGASLGTVFSIVDFKTHKPAREDGPSYVEDRLQTQGYEIACWEMGVIRYEDHEEPHPVEHLIVLLCPDGSFIEDARRIEPSAFLAVRQAYRELRGI